nr:WYL domain-containing protein [Pelovirga terrestris]
MTTVYEALFHDRRFLGTYRSRNEKKEREFVVNPLGLIFSDPVVYLAATLWDYDDVRLYALHRFSSARMLADGISRPSGFRFDEYLNKGAVEFPATDAAGPSNLVFRMKEDVARHLFESPLSKDQKIKPDQEGWVQITATVKNTQQLRWWLLGFGDKVEVLAPEGLRGEFVGIVESLRQIYL